MFINFTSTRYTFDFLMSSIFVSLIVHSSVRPWVVQLIVVFRTSSLIGLTTTFRAELSHSISCFSSGCFEQFPWIILFIPKATPRKSNPTTTTTATATAIPGIEKYIHNWKSSSSYFFHLYSDVCLLFSQCFFSRTKGAGTSMRLNKPGITVL